VGNEKPVWDILVRVFHWSLVLFFSIAYLSGEEESVIHVYSGYIILGLISLRIIWGVIGSKYARFSNFIYSREDVVTYLKSLLTRNPKHYMGHNPAGGWMVVALIIAVLTTTITGLKLYAVEEGLGPLAGNAIEMQLISSAYADDDGHHGDKHEDPMEEFWEELHEFAANLTLLLVLVHIAGVLVSSLLHRENLVRAMITGIKKSNDN
jgi:cytochrome b